MLKNAASASPAIAFASSVLPVPGAPTMRMPLGMRPPSFWNFFGSLRNSTSSETSSFASSTPATSLKVVLFFSLASIRALLFPKLKAPLPAILICRMKKNQMSRPMTRMGRIPQTSWSNIVLGALTSNNSVANSLSSNESVNRTLATKLTPSSKLPVLSPTLTYLPRTSCRSD